MADRYTDDHGQPRFGVRVSPEEFERIRREQGIESPAAPVYSADDAAASSIPPVPVPPHAPESSVGQVGIPGGAGGPTGTPLAPSGTPTVGEESVTGRATASSPDQRRAATDPTGRTESGLASPPPGGWSWQREPSGGSWGSRYQARPGEPASIYASGQPGRGAGVGEGRRWHRWRMVVIGVVLLTLVPAVMTLTAVVRVVDGPMTSAGVLASDGQVYLDEGQHVGLYATASEAAVGQCEVRAPSGAKVDLVTADEQLGIAGEAEAADALAAPYASLTAPETGIYTVTCQGGTAGLVVGPALNLDKAVSSGWLVIGAFLSGLVGLVLTIAGIVRVVRRR